MSASTPSDDNNTDQGDHAPSPSSSPQTQQRSPTNDVKDDTGIDVDAQPHRSDSITDHGKLVVLRREYKKLSKAFGELRALYIALRDKEKEKDEEIEEEGEKEKEKQRIELESLTMENESLQMRNTELQEAQSQLESDLSTMRERVNLADEFQSRMQKRNHLLSEDRAMLTSQISQLKDRVKELEEQVSVRDEALQALGQKHEAITLEAYESKLAVPRAVELQNSDTQFRERFGLPLTEFEIEKYSCFYKAYPGTLYITPSFICFGSSSLIGGGSSSNIVVHIDGIETVEKTQAIKLPFRGGSGHGMKFLMKDGDSFAFSGVLNRDLCYENVIQRISHVQDPALHA